MQQAFESYSPETIERLKKNGLKEYKPKPIQNWQNPHSAVFYSTNLILLGVCFAGRYLAQKQGSPRLIWSLAAVSVPFFTLSSTAKLDQQDTMLGKRKTLEDNLDFNPITRRAWNEAIKINQEYQKGLKQEILQLESQKK